MKKVLCLIGTILFIVMTAAGCGSKNDLADCFNEETVRAETEKAIAHFNDKNYQALIDEGNTVFIDSLSLDQWQETCDPYVDKAGSFESIDSMVIAGQKGNDGRDYAVAIAVVKYSDGKIQFSIVFDDEMKLAQFFIK